MKEGEAITDRYLSLIENNVAELMRLGRASPAVRNVMKANSKRITNAHSELGKIVQWLSK